MDRKQADGFLHLLATVNGGSLEDELDRELRAAVEAITQYGGKAEITLRVAVSRIPNMDSAVNIKHAVALKAPEAPRPEAALFITADGGLTDQHQKQEPLALGEPTEPAALRLQTVDRKTGEVIG